MSTTARLGKLFALALTLWATQTVGLGLQLPAGVVQTFEDTSDPDTYFIPVAAWDGTRVPAVAVDGNIVRQSWRMPAVGLTPLQVLAPLRDQLTEQGFTTLLDCVDIECGGFDFNYGTETLLAPHMYVNLSDFRFLSAVHEAKGQFVSVLVSHSAENIFLQIIQAGPSGQQQAAVKAPEVATTTPVIGTSLAQRLETQGHVVLNDLEFQSGSSELGDGLFQSLQDLARYLQNNPDREVVLVGHTDAVGTLVGNISLSKQRASSVADRLVSDYGVSADQLSAQGVGFLSPIASNLTPEGRLQNRRVDAVLISTE